MADERDLDASWGTFSLRGWRAGMLNLLHALPTGSAWRRIALWLRKPLKSLVGPVDVEVWGLRLRLMPRGNLSEHRLLLMPQHLDVVEREALSEQLSGGGVFLDNVHYWASGDADIIGRDEGLSRVRLGEPEKGCTTGIRLMTGGRAPLDRAATCRLLAEPQTTDTGELFRRIIAPE